MENLICNIVGVIRLYVIKYNIIIAIVLKIMNKTETAVWRFSIDDYILTTNRKRNTVCVQRLTVVFGIKSKENKVSVMY